MELINEIENNNIHNEIVLSIYNELDIIKLNDMEYDIIRYFDSIKRNPNYNMIHILRTRRLLDFCSERIKSLEFDSVNFN